jgi:hypothetical protein
VLARNGRVQSVARERMALGYLSHVLESDGLMVFIELHGFRDDWRTLGLTDDELWVVQEVILADPKGSPVVPGTGGLRKLRFAPQKSKGKKDWFRVGYVYFPDAGTVLLVVAYAKSERDDLSAADKKDIRDYIAGQRTILNKRPVK